MNSNFVVSSHQSVARWRWWVALLLMSALPLLVAFSALRRHQSGDDTAMLPLTVPGLLWFCALQLGAFAILWGIFWLFSRANRDELFLRYRGPKSLLWGVGYSLIMRLSIGIVATLVLMTLAMLGFDMKQVTATLESNSESIRDALAPAFASRDPLYGFLLLTLLSFGVAGLREELWRVATLAGIFHLAPTHWSQQWKNGVALAISSALFGLGHFYQGATGMIGTAVLGVILGAITLRHRSIWPAVIAHGCFDAASFAALSALGK